MSGAGGDPAVLSVVWNLIRGGTEGQCARVALGLAGRGLIHRVAVFRREGFFLPAVERACGPVWPFTITGRLRPSTPLHIARLAARIRRENIRLVHAWDMDACLFGGWAARLAGVPLVTSRRDLGQIYPAWKLRRLAATERRARRVVVNARAIGAVAARAGVAENRIRLIPNLLDTEEFDRLAGSGGPPAGGVPRIVQVARLDREKDTGTLLDAAALLRREGLAFELVLAGDGTERAALEARARRDGLPVTFLGEVREVPALLTGAAIGVLLPFANEGLSNTVLEYMAAGLPSVVSACGGNPELIRDGENGRVVPPRDPAAAAAALKSLLLDPALAAAMGRRARADVEAGHAPGVVLDRFQALYAEVAHGRAS